jgi:two-component system heavy metal sensor histidine kinase CusS
MKSVGLRIAFWYALASLLTLGCFFRVGRFLVEEHVVHSLDAGIGAEFAQVTRRLGPDVASLEVMQIQERLSLNPSVRYFIEIHDVADRIVYRSRNLHDRGIPATAAPEPLLSRVLARTLHVARPAAPKSVGADRRSYNGIVGDLGEMRVGEFKLAQLTVRVATSNEQVRNLVEAYQDVFYGMVAVMAVASAIIEIGRAHV